MEKNPITVKKQIEQLRNNFTKIYDENKFISQR